MFNLKIKKSNLIVSNKEPLASGASKVYYVSFDFDEEWDGLLKNVIFKAGETSVAVLLEGTSCPIPWEVLSKDNIGEKLWVGVYGSDTEGTKLPTVWNTLEVIQAGAELCGSGSEPTPTAVSLIYEVAKNAESMAENAVNEASLARTHADRAEEARSTASSASAEAMNAVGQAQEQVRLASNEAERAKAAAQDAAESAVEAERAAEEAETAAANAGGWFADSFKSVLYGIELAKGADVAIPDGAFNSAKVLSLEGGSSIVGKALIPSALSIESGGKVHSVPDVITSLPGYGHGAGEGYNNTVDFKRGKYTRRCSFFEPMTVPDYYPTYFDGLTFEFPVSRYDEWVSAIETVKCSHSELSFEYYEVIQNQSDKGMLSCGMLHVILNGKDPTDSELQAFIDAERAAGTPVVICYGIPNPIETDISELDTELYIPVTPGGEVTFNGGVGDLQIFIPKEFPDKPYISKVSANALRGKLYGSAVSADDVSPLEHELDIRVSNKNIIPFPYYSRSSENFYESGIAFTVNDDGSVLVNSDTAGVGATKNIQFHMKYETDNNPILVTQDAIISGSPVHPDSGVKLQAICIQENGSYAYISADGPNPWIKKGWKIERIFIGVSKGIACDNLLFKPQIEYGTVATEFTPPSMDVEGVNVTISNGENTHIGTADAEGNVTGLASLAPSMTLISDNDGAVIECTYNRDTNKVIEELTNAIISLGGNI